MNHSRTLAGLLGLSCLFGLILTGASALAAEEGATRTLTPEEILVLGPQRLAAPAFHETAPNAFGGEEALSTAWVDLDGPPAVGEEVRFGDGSRLSWSSLPLSSSSLGGAGKDFAVAYLAVYVEAERFVKATAVAKGTAFLDLGFGDDFRSVESVATKTTAEEGEASGEVSLTPGHHLLLVKAVAAGGAVAAQLELKVPEERAGEVSFSLSPRHGLALGDLLDAETAEGVVLSPDGAYAAVQLKQPRPRDEGSDSRWEIRRTADGELLRTLHGGEGSFRWLPKGEGEEAEYSYTTTSTGTNGEDNGDKKDKKDLWVASLASGGAERILERFEGLESYRWLPGGESLVAAVTVKEEKDERGLKRYRSLRDRWGTWRNREHLVQVDRASGALRPLTAGPDDVDLQDVSPDGSRVLFSIELDRPTEEPFSFAELYELELESLALTKLRRITWFNEASYGPSGERILVRAGPQAFGDLGEAVPEGVQPNQYDGQLYLLERELKEASTLTRSFDPAVENAEWLDSGEIVVRAQDGSRLSLFHYRPGQGFFPLDAGLEVVEEMSVARRTGRVAALGSSSRLPPRVRILGTGAGETAKDLVVPDAERWENTTWGEVKDFPVELEGGSLPGRIHFPEGFDGEGSYPLIVYYYGGTLPTDRRFGGRYPHDVWASHGYVVYTPQPSGATGWGQEYSARHVNNWGKTTADEIIRGTEAVLEAYPGLDRQSVGCIGASYGGFMTMLLTTRTDLFSAAVSHAGISSISSYWGEGWWGFAYSAAATAGSYPWNRPDVYVDQSPLFEADEIETPLLLLHGTADTNVPIGESQQLYTALEILGRDVELVTIEGQDHRIVDPAKKRLWSQTILAFFDWKLKGQPEWWQDLYGTEEEPKG